jgi:hypothetical protein
VVSFVYETGPRGRSLAKRSNHPHTAQHPSRSPGARLENSDLSVQAPIRGGSARDRRSNASVRFRFAGSELARAPDRGTSIWTRLSATFLRQARWSCCPKGPVNHASTAMLKADGVGAGSRHFTNEEALLALKTSLGSLMSCRRLLDGWLLRPLSCGCSLLA